MLSKIEETKLYHNYWDNIVVVNNPNDFLGALQIFN